MRILFLGRNDWANIANRVARALNKTPGAPTARVFTMGAHPLGYQEDMVAELGTHRNLFDFAADIDWLISTGDGDYEFFRMMHELLPLPVTARLATCHVGSAYRNNAAAYKIADGQIGFERRFIGGDLYRFDVDDPRAVPYFAPPNTMTTAPWWPLDGPVRIGHSPTHRANKGTDRILSALSQIEGAAVDLIEGVSFKECAERRAKCRIFVDQMEPSIGGFGASTVEALAAGCAVLADIRHVVPAVDKFYPRPPIIDVRTEDDLRARLTELIGDPALLEQTQRASLVWAEEHAGAKAVAYYWTSHLL